MGRPGGEDGLPGGLGEYPASDAAALRAHLISRRLPGSRVDELNTDQLGAPKPREKRRHDDRSIE
jgi:hypothetical protein